MLRENKLDELKENERNITGKGKEPGEEEHTARQESNQNRKLISLAMLAYAKIVAACRTN